MKMKRMNNSEMIRSHRKVCQFCGREVSREVRICPKCGRLLMRDLRKPEWEDFIEPDNKFEINVRMATDLQMAFETIPEEKETGDYYYG